MDGLHPRLLVTDFAACFRFYDAVLPALTGARRVKGDKDGPYAQWDLGEEALLILCDRALMAEVTGSAGGDPADSVMFVCRVADVADAYTRCLAASAAPVAPPADRPQWGAGLRTAHVRDPQGTLVELQAY
ncbi:VOC family protein [Streptomyces sp. NPDC059740]|uniref:VOC family protein n=1 Tax=Streptomyces sp. NPDC059740 TaxID=3346926 RepID=UPI00364A42C9